MQARLPSRGRAFEAEGDLTMRELRPTPVTFPGNSLDFHWKISCKPGGEEKGPMFPCARLGLPLT
jgi:hypothetical protein